jgi:DNA-binding transcriptional LysR family regulator
LRIGYLAAPAQQYLSGAFSDVRRSYPETDLKLVNLSPGEQIIALRAGEIDASICRFRPGTIQSLVANVYMSWFPGGKARWFLWLEM